MSYAVLSSGSYLILIDFKKNEIIKTIKIHNHDITIIALNKNANQCATAS